MSTKITNRQVAIDIIEKFLAELTWEEKRIFSEYGLKMKTIIKWLYTAKQANDSMGRNDMAAKKAQEIIKIEQASKEVRYQEKRCKKTAADKLGKELLCLSAVKHFLQAMSTLVAIRQTASGIEFDIIETDICSLKANLNRSKKNAKIGIELKPE